MIRIDGENIFRIDDNEEEQFSICQVLPEAHYDSTTSGDLLMGTFDFALIQIKSLKSKEQSQYENKNILLNEMPHPKGRDSKTKMLKNAFQMDRTITDMSMPYKLVEKNHVNNSHICG